MKRTGPGKSKLKRIKGHKFRQMNALLLPPNLKMGEKVFDLFEYEGQKVNPENHPCFDPNKSTVTHNPDGSVTNNTRDLSYRMNCFSSANLEEKFVDDEEKEAFMSEHGNMFDKIKKWVLFVRGDQRLCSIHGC